MKKLHVKIHGTHCASCEVLIERALKKIPGVEKADVRFATGETEVLASDDSITIRHIEDAVRAGGYTVSWWHERHAPVAVEHRNGTKEYAEIGAVFLFLVAIYTVLSQFSLLPRGFGITDTMGYGLVFAIGLVAALSTCLAVAGGLLLAVAAKYNESYPNLSPYQKFKPTLYFNVGRVISYTSFGAIIGTLGSVVSLSPFGTGILSIIASIVMIILGFQMLHIFPWMKRLQPRMPKFIAHGIHDLAGKDSKMGPFTLGGLTFFLPCGFTQALQLYVLSKGSPAVGALTMLAFSLGTLPALLSLGFVSSFAKGTFQKRFIRFSAVLVVMLGFWNINNGLALAGINVNLGSFARKGSIAEIALAPMENGAQIVRMKVSGLDYIPSRFAVREGVPVEWRIDGSGAQGCAQVIVVPSLGITKYLPQDKETVIQFTPQETGDISFSCSMGMTTRDAGFSVIPGTGDAARAAAPAENSLAALSSACDPAVQNCLPVQALSMEISEERGFYPSSFTVKKGVPVEVTIDDKVPLGGCMGVMVIPQYEVTLPLRLGKNTLAFTPTQTGTTYATCSMGSKMIQFNVIN